jgi:hypothetical protein
VSGLGGDPSVTWVAAVATVVVLGGLLGERRLFGLAQHLLAGLATGYLAVLALREVLLPELVAPLAAAPASRLDLWLGLALVALTASAPWLPRRLAAVPLAILIGSLAAFALGGALIGTALPQASAAVVGPGDAQSMATGLVSLAITALVLVAFVRPATTSRLGLVAAGSSTGRWLLLAGIGGWLGYLLVTRLVLLLDRIGFLLFDWLRVGA